MAHTAHRWRSLRLITDIWMTAGLLYSMGYQLFPQSSHEWSGAVLLCLFICHHLLNYRWYATLARGRYTPARLLGSCVDLALLVFIVILMWSGIAMSQYVFAFLPASSGMGMARGLHRMASRWAFILMAFHLGLHWHALLRHRKQPERGAWVLQCLAAAAAAFGVCAFIAQDFPSDMFLVSTSVFPDFVENPVFFCLQYLSIFELFIFAGYRIRRFTGHGLPLRQS